MREILTTLLDLIGAGLLVAFGFLVWPPAALLVAGVLVLYASQILAARRGGGAS